MLKSKLYWRDRSVDYPFQVEVKHMSGEDLDTARFSRMTKEDFLRVPFEGVSHWGFKTQKALDHFKRIAGII